MTDMSWVQTPHCGEHFSCTIHLDQSMEAKIEWKLTRHCCICCNPEKGRVDFKNKVQLQTNLTEKNRGISTVENHKKTVGFFRLG
jgi:hypothetical protein